MFQFTREFVINDVNGKLRVDGTTNYKSQANGTVKSKFALANDTLYIDNLVNLRKQDVIAVYKTPFQDSQKEKVVLTTNSFNPTSEVTVRLVVGLGQQGRVIATFNDHYPDHTKRYFYEATGSSAAEIVAGLMKAIARDNSLTDDRYADITLTPTTITVEALDPYTTVKEIRLVEVNTSYSSHVGAALTGYEDYKVLVNYDRDVRDANGDATATGSLATSGATVAVDYASQGAGSANYIINNLRLQTDANLNPYGENRDERPVPGGEYDQYLVEIATEHRHMSPAVVGSVNTSLTSFVFFVLRNEGCETSPSEVFETVLKKLVGEDCIKEIKVDDRKAELEASTSENDTVDAMESKVQRKVKVEKNTPADKNEE